MRATRYLILFLTRVATASRAEKCCWVPDGAARSRTPAAQLKALGALKCGVPCGGRLEDSVDPAVLGARRGGAGRTSGSPSVFQAEPRLGVSSVCF